MGPISNINVPKNKVKNLNSCSLFSKSCCVSLLQEDVHRSHRAHNTVDQIFKHALLLALTSTLITLTLSPSPSHSARGVLTTVTQPAQLWSVGTACTGRKRCVSISARMCLRVCVSHQLVHCGRFTPPPSYCRSGCSVCIVSKTWHMRDAERNLNKAGTAVIKVWNQSLAEELTKRVELPTSWISDWSKRTR